MSTQLLKALYQNNQHRLNALKTEFSEQSLHGPYLCSPAELYLQQDTRLVCVGQETYGWESHDDIGQQMEAYREFNLGIKYTKASPFWHLIRELEDLLTGCRYSSAALNLNRFDFNGKKPNFPQAIRLSAIDDMLADEIRILDPHVCIFFTGHTYDYRLEKLYPGLEKVEISEIPKSSICRLKHPNLPVHTYRTYHPGFLRRAKLRPKFLQLMSGVKSDLSKNI